MSDLGPSQGRRLLQWLAALIGEMNCLYVPAVFAQSDGTDFPFPVLHFIEIAALGVLVLAFVALRSRLGRRWNALPWIAAGIILAFVILGGFSIGPFLIPALIAFVALGILIDWEAGGSMIATKFGLLLMAAVAQGAVMIVAIPIS